MKFILNNMGNVRHFNQCAKTNLRTGALIASFTVNAWYSPKRTPRRMNYDAGFHVTKFKKIGVDCRKLGANFQNEVFQKGVLYRIRVWPKVALQPPYIGCRNGRGYGF